MSENLIETQKRIESELEDLRSQRDELTRQIILKRKEFDLFLENNGNAVIKEENRRRWMEGEPERERARQTPEWQAWRRKFLSERGVKVD